MTIGSAPTLTWFGGVICAREVAMSDSASSLTWYCIGMDGVLRCGSCFVFDTAMFGPCMESGDVGCCLSDVWSVNGSCNVGCCFVFGMVQYRYCGWR